MNKLYALLLGLTLTTVSVSCKKETEILAPTPTDEASKPGSSTNPQPSGQAGAVTPVGNPVGAVITANIGPAGGRIESSDQRIRVEIPAGALSQNQTISVQALDENHCPGGTGTAFRLLPHGLTFTKPATVTVQYANEDVQGSAPEFLRIAYQNDKGVWQSPAVSHLDTAARMVSVKTTHFSDWAGFQNIKLTSNSAAVNPGGSVELEVVQYVMGAGDDVFGIPTIPSKIEQKYISKWEVSSKEGTLIHQITKGTYYAPASIPAKNPIAVSVYLNKTITIDGQVFRDLRVVANIFVAPEGISVSIDGGNWVTFPGGVNIGHAQKVVLGNLGADYVSLTWPGKGTGTHRWTLGTGVAFHMDRGTRQYGHIYEENKKPVVSGGFVTVHQYGDNLILGTFDVTPAGWISPSTPTNPLGRGTVKGVFRLSNVVR